MGISLSSIIAGLVFGAVGIVVLRLGKKDANLTALFLGIALMAYPYFVENIYLLWSIGIILSAWSYRELKH